MPIQLNLIPLQESFTAVAPRSLREFETGENAFGGTSHLSARSAGLTIRFAVRPSGANVALMRRTLKARRSRCGTSVVPSSEKQTRRKSFAVATIAPSTWPDQRE
jgi:hypothetical protein